ncbi:MAG: hypothetical protein ABIP48_06950 [Planctomycetota bacterium]
MKPVLQALLLADRIYEDKATGKKIVAGIFQAVFFKKAEDLKAELEKRGVSGAGMPGGFHAGSPYAYISLTDLRGTQPFVLRYVDLGEDKPVFEAAFTVSSDDPLKTVEIIAPLPPLPTTKAGTFALELLWNDEPLGSFRVTVKELQIEGTSDDTDAND